MYRFEGHTDRVYSVIFSPDGTRLASASQDATIRLWDVATGQEVRRLEQGDVFWVNSLAFSLDGIQLVSGGASQSSAGTSGKIRLWDVATGQMVRSFGGSISGVGSLAFSPDGTQLASGLYDDTIRLWDVVTGQEVRRFTGHTRGASSIVFSSDGSHLVSGASDSSIRMWDAATGQQTDRLSHGYPVLSMALSNDGRLIASAGGTVLRLWDATATVLETVLSSPEIPATFTHYPNPAGISATIEYSLLKAGQVQLSVHDLLGREVAKVLDAVQTAGHHSLQLTTEQLSGGVYFLRFIADDRQMTRPLIVC